MVTFIQASVIFLLMCGELGIVQGCKHDEYEVRCDIKVGVPGDLCPGVTRWPCHYGHRRCACVKGTFQRWDAHCVPKRDCVIRAFDPGNLLGVQEDLIMVGLSTTIFDIKALKCFISPRAKPVHYSYHRLVNYQKFVGGKWQKMYFDLGITLQHYGERVMVEEGSAVVVLVSGAELDTGPMGAAPQAILVTSEEVGTPLQATGVAASPPTGWNSEVGVVGAGQVPR
ncbi:uncharacterized protein LOC142588699 [Dermacentor variabilis]|uniref:uncharacterized protein LOC142588699 n=1 Tax=Dermacentor variabilis TaxID=34621 RepID=UPI003F5BAD42